MRTALACALLLCAAVPAHAQRASYEEIQTFSAVMNLIRLNHVDSVSYTPLVRAAIEGALAAVDPHSRYVRRDAEARLIAARSGELAVSGMELDALHGVVTVMSVGSGSPAERAGMLAGDRVITVQDSSVAGLGAHEVELLLTGSAGETRHVGVDRGDSRAPERVSLAVRLERYTWPNIAAPLMIAEDIGYVRLGGFGERAAVELERALDGLRGRGMRRLLLDMRGNPGGRLSEAVSIAGLFLPKDALVMEMRGRKSDANGEYRTRSAGDYGDLPLVVLVDGSSASAAEALAGALQDHRRAIIAGHRTFGKALVQSPFPLPAGDVLWLTIARVHTPSGRMIQRSYDGLSAGQYAAAAETLRRGGPDAAAAGTGGIEPDVWFDPRPPLPPWWQEFRRNGHDIAAAQRAEAGTRATDDAAQWRQPLLDAFRAVITENDGAVPALTAAQEDAIARHLSWAAVRIRSGDAAAAAFAVTSDPEVMRAAALLDPR